MNLYSASHCSQRRCDLVRHADHGATDHDLCHCNNQKIHKSAVKENAEEVLVGKLQKVLELLNRIIFSAAFEIRAYYIMYLQDWGEKLKIIFRNCSPNTH